MYMARPWDKGWSAQEKGQNVLQELTARGDRQGVPRGLLEPGVRPSCMALAWSCAVMLPGVAKAARSLHT